MASVSCFRVCNCFVSSFIFFQDWSQNPVGSEIIQAVFPNIFQRFLQRFAAFTLVYVSFVSPFSVVTSQARVRAFLAEESFFIIAGLNIDHRFKCL